MKDASDEAWSESVWDPARASSESAATHAASRLDSDPARGLRVLFCVIPEKGHLNPYIGPAQALQDAGAEVFFHAGADITAQLEAAGIAGFVGERTPPPTDTHRGALFAERVRDAPWLRQWIKTLLVDVADQGIAPLRALMQRLRPDVIALDPMVYPAAIAAELEGLPWAAISNSLNPVLPDALDSELLRTVRWLDADRRALFARYGLAPRFRGCDLLSPHLTIAFSTEALAGPVDDVELVGPSLPRGARGDEVPFPWEELDATRPLVYASFGSQIYHQPALFGRLVEALRSRPVQLVLSASELATSGELGALPPNVLARPYVPQLALLARASAFVTHGGANSVMEAITFGVPLLVTPLCNDQFHQAHFVERAGIGRAIEPREASIEALRGALDALLADGPERRRMAEVSASYRRDGAAEAARLLIALAARTRRARGS